MTRISLVGILLLGLAFSASAEQKQDVDIVLTGLDVIQQDGFKILEGKKVALVTNHTAIDSKGNWIIDIFSKAPNVEMTVLFSPEHGLKGLLDEHVGDTKDEKTGLKVYSLYGKTRRPSPEMLKNVDVIVFDIQDIGTRFYTYIATMGNCMEVAAELDIEYVVLDRPNPITGTRVFGPMNDTEGRFTSYHWTPLVHGMTVGELAKMFNKERKINCKLQVVEMMGWERDMWFDETNLIWINPSPNMRNLTEATLYPGIGMIEGCKISVGRGTDTPFEVFGAPWIKERKLAAALNARKLDGIRFIPYRFTPDSSKYKGEECGGVQIVVTDRNALDPTIVGLVITQELWKLFGEDFTIDKVNNLIFNKELVQKIKKTPGMKDFKATWKTGLKDFMKKREKYLLYK